MNILKATVVEYRSASRRCASAVVAVALAAVFVFPIGADGLGQAAGLATDGNRIDGDHVNGDTLTTRNGSGWLRTITPTGAIDTANPFFQSLGSNGRSCNTCHQIQDGWSITPKTARQRFNATDGNDPLFRTNDGSNSPLVDVSTVAKRRVAYSMLINRGLIRVGMGVPGNAEFTLDAVDDPYRFASAAELSLFRRPLPTTNLAFLTGVMWDARETVAPFLPPMDAGVASTNLLASLRHQAVDATIGHAQALSAPTIAQLEQIVGFEAGLTTAQIRDDRAGFLNDNDAIGGPRILANQRFHVGINDTLGADPAGSAFNPTSMAMFAAWADDEKSLAPDHVERQQREAIARGENLFNGKVFAIADVGGLNDALGMPVIAGTCTTCHNAPNVGNHTVALPLNIGLSDASRRTPDMPLYTLRNKTTGDTEQTTDPGLALLTGRWKDIGKFKGPILRGVVAHPPYFHNGSAATLDDAVNFYDTRFKIGFSAREKNDLVAFLQSL